MQIAIDIGNSSIKAGIFPESNDALPATSSTGTRNEPVETLRIFGEDIDLFRNFVSRHQISACAISSTSVIPSWLTDELGNHNLSPLIINGTTPLPIRNLYETPLTLGTDRLCSVIGAYYNSGCNHPVMCIDSGTALTFDIINSSGEYIGGNISPGLSMRARALHEFTSRLPLVDLSEPETPIGTTTETAIRNGIIRGVINEINGYIHYYNLKFPKLQVYFTGGGSINFANRLKKRIFADENLVLKGINIVLSHVMSLQSIK